MGPGSMSIVFTHLKCFHSVNVWQSSVKKTAKQGKKIFLFVRRCDAHNGPFYIFCRNADRYSKMAASV